jgi:molybdopterin-guanine dinucleotide biosynthesis protein B
MIRVLSVTGFHKAGKTRIVVSIVRELTKRGYLVGTVKHIPEKDFTIDQPGKDTWAHAKAGAKLVVSMAPGEVAKVEKCSAKIEEVLQGLQGLDFIIIEGFKAFSGPAKIVVAKTEGEAKKLIDKFTIACVGAECLSVPTFSFEQVKGLVDLVEQKAYPLTFNLNCGHCGFDSCEDFAVAVVSGKRRWNGCVSSLGRFSLTVDGKSVPLNPFTQKILEGAIKGMLSSLKGTKGDKIEIKVVGRAG